MSGDDAAREAAYWPPPERAYWGPAFLEAGDLLGALLSENGACPTFLRWPVRPTFPVRPPRVWARRTRRTDGDDPGTRDHACYVLALDPCAYCGEPVEAVDHIEPHAFGGPDHWTNYVGACSRCNASKGGKPLLRFLLTRSEPDR